MRTILKSMAVAACALTASAAFAAPTITSASLTGVGSTSTAAGTSWNTAKDKVDTLFLQRPLGNVLNPTDNFTSAALSNPVDGAFDFSISGNGAADKSSTASALSYLLTVNVADGSKTGTLSGVYTLATDTFVPGTSSFVSGGLTYNLSDFSWSRTKSNTVGAFSSTPTNDGSLRGQGTRADYTGAFTINAASTAVPEPATWGLMILGFGLVGGTLRVRRGRELAGSLA